MTEPANLVLNQSDDHCDLFVARYDRKGRVRVVRALRDGEFVVADLSTSGAEAVRNAVLDPGIYRATA